MVKGVKLLARGQVPDLDRYLIWLPEDGCRETIPVGTDGDWTIDFPNGEQILATADVEDVHLVLMPGKRNQAFAVRGELQTENPSPGVLEFTQLLAGGQVPDLQRALLPAGRQALPVGAE